MNRKLVALLLALLLGAVSLGGVAMAEAEPEHLTIGVIIWSVDDTLSYSVVRELEHAGSILNVDFIFKGGSVDAASQVTDVENLIAAEVDGILMCPMVDTTTNKFVRMCEEAGVPIAFMFRGIEDAATREECFASDAFVGYVCEGEEASGADLVDKVVAAGRKNVAFFCCEPGNIVTDRRQEGMYARAEEIGLNVVSSYVMPAGTLASGFVEGATAIMATYPECDAFVLSFGSDGGIDALVQYVTSNGLVGKVNIATFDSAADPAAAFADGVLIAQTCGSMVDPLYAFMMLYNELQGTPLSEEPVGFNSNYIYVTNGEEAQVYDKYWDMSDYKLYSADEIKNMTKFYNPDFTIEALGDVIAAYSFEDVIARAG